jgi:5-methylcytosine-specific restriction endonuclease McrA
MSARKVNVGNIYESNHWGFAEVVELLGNRSVVRFHNTGNTANLRNREITSGAFSDSIAAKSGAILSYINPRKGENALLAGSIYTTNFWGNIQVLEYNGNKNVLVEFEDTGNRYTVQKQNILKGLIADLRQSVYLTEKENKRVKTSSKVFTAILRYLSKVTKDKRTKLRQEEISDKLRQKEKDIELGNLERMQETHTSKYGGDYNIVKFLTDKTVDIQFHNSKFILNVKNTYIGKNPVDTSIYSKEELRREYAVKDYEKNKEARIAQATKWQKDNPEAVQVRNNKRRVRELSLSGSYTKTEATKLYEDQDGFCAGCNADLSFEKHLDHIMPLALGGSNSIENLQWLCPFCNLSKNAKHPNVWLKEIQTDAWKVRRNNRKNP